MEESENFAAYCQNIIADYTSGMIDMTTAAEIIALQPLDESAHLMLHRIKWAAYDIGEDYRGPKENKEDWEYIIKTIGDYTSLNWEPSYWALALTYSEMKGEKITHSYSAIIRRQNGKISVITPLKNIEEGITKTISKLNPEQTDYWFLQNLALALPKKIDSYLLTVTEIKEHLVVPDYSTAPGNN